MTKNEKIEKAVSAAKEAQVRDDICARSVLVGLKTVFDRIPEEMITATMSLAGGTGGASGSCGAYCCGLMAVGLYYNAPLEEERVNPEKKQIGSSKFNEYRERFKKEMGTVLCPEIHEKVFGRRYVLYDPVQHEEFLSMPGHQVKCAEVVGLAAKIAAEMILEGEAD
jgi:C_GCAxxG_C_C family probable redox protein